MPPIPERKRKAILKDVRAGKMSRNAIARKHGVAPSSIRLIADRAGIESAFDRSTTKSATRAHMVDLAAKRAELAELLLEDARALRDRAWDPYPVVNMTPDGPEITYLPLPPARDTQALYTALGISVDKHLVITKHDADPGTDSAKSMLADLGRALGVAAEALSEPDVG